MPTKPHREANRQSDLVRGKEIMRGEGDREGEMDRAIAREAGREGDVQSRIRKGHAN